MFVNKCRNKYRQIINRTISDTQPKREKNNRSVPYEWEDKLSLERKKNE